ncbi:MAG: hypothetical protein ACFFCX_12095 [Candidatus Sifarchaeia archaeon]
MNANEAFERGRQEMESGRLEKAIEAFDESASLSPSYFDTWWALASACNLFGTQLEAEGEYKRANMYKVKAAYSFDRATRAEPTNPRETKQKRMLKQFEMPKHVKRNRDISNQTSWHQTRSKSPSNSG